MANPISALVAQISPAKQTGSVNTVATRKNSISSGILLGTSGGDSVKISLAAQTKSLYQMGKSVEQIAFQLGIDASTVKTYLGFPGGSAKETAGATNNLTKLLPLMYESGVDIRVVRNYLGLPSESPKTPNYKTYGGISGS